jgi:hypothetical protein
VTGCDGELTMLAVPDEDRERPTVEDGDKLTAWVKLALSEGVALAGEGDSLRVTVAWATDSEAVADVDVVAVSSTVAEPVTLRSPLGESERLGDALLGDPVASIVALKESVIILVVETVAESEPVQVPLT